MVDSLLRDMVVGEWGPKARSSCRSGPGRQRCLSTGSPSMSRRCDEATLDASIAPGTASFELTEEPRHILLTGATGFLGAFVLRELLDRTRAHVHCLVRAATMEDGKARLRQTLQSYSLWDGSRVQNRSGSW